MPFGSNNECTLCSYPMSRHNCKVKWAGNKMQNWEITVKSKNHWGLSWLQLSANFQQVMLVGLEVVNPGKLASRPEDLRVMATDKTVLLQ